MPYIRKEIRIKLEPEIEALAEKIDEVIVEADRAFEIDGVLNYTFTMLIEKLLPKEFNRYTDYNMIIGVLESCKLEYYRKMVAGYEDKKELENGIVKNLS